MATAETKVATSIKLEERTNQSNSNSSTSKAEQSPSSNNNNNNNNLDAKTSSNSLTNNNNNNNNNSKKLPSFNDLLWCPDVDGDVMTHQGIGGAMLSSMPMSEDSLEDLSELVGPELANLVHGSVQPVKVSTSSANSTPLTDMPADISDLRSSDLLQTFPDIDIDRIFAEFQAEHSNNS
eukprot:maker-scaffold139_size317827-snap-gene-0.21 protein:Tk05008 transcript:maker-scaffold139_size317827-snap-gene-0.21-mRNA-1 annotation:"---NA---"